MSSQGATSSVDASAIASSAAIDAAVNSAGAATAANDEYRRKWRYHQPLLNARKEFAVNGPLLWAGRHCSNGVVYAKPLPPVVPIGASASTAERVELGLPGIHMSGVNHAEISTSRSFVVACIDPRCALVRHRPEPGGVAIPSKGTSERLKFATPGVVTALEVQALQWQLQHGLSAAAIADITKDHLGGSIDAVSVKVLLLLLLLMFLRLLLLLLL
jgi:hypothetical protein